MLQNGLFISSHLTATLAYQVQFSGQTQYIKEITQRKSLGKSISIVLPFYERLYIANLKAFIKR